ncbi:glycosyltransferase family 2 protein [Rhodobacter ferrooxidans]|uniref:Glycosyl transferase family 2 n=1 Tax=Rhodobacter ferrooxidans TaxID=371731 RepID=C8RWX6_9RHOB|nr:glycosyltransferase [Rhodobacter sp. SW2]EEW26501.1 glycosyl transferase family 2 [Rhodobacter sp. SW2]
MALPEVSLIIVSRHRPQALLRAIAGVRQMDHPRFELIVVADPEACTQVQAAGVVAKVVAFDEANISAARNIGLAQAAGEVVAYLDDDAVPEPTWLSRLVAPFADDRVVAATGFVRGRNGLSFQWRAMEVDACGQDHPLSVDPVAVSLHHGAPSRAVKTCGTNCAFRAAALRAIGGFDPAFRFYLDEADVNLRLAALGGLTAVVPLAEVHHGFAASARRRTDRVPLSLFEIGASSMLFLRRHAPLADHAPALARLWADQRARALRAMVAGRIAPGDVGRLMHSLQAGLAAGETRPLGAQLPLKTSDSGLLPLPGTGPRPGRVITGRSWQRGRLEAEARAAADRGAVVTLIRLSPTALFHSLRFDADGIWRQTGGLFGRSDRQQPLVRLWRFPDRVAQEARHLARVRPIPAHNQG